MVPLVFRESRASFRTVYSYILSEFLFSFIVSFLFFFFIFFVNQLLLLAEEILSKNVSFKNVALIIFYSLPSIIAFALPFASLVAGLMAVGRLSSDNEILAMQASGVSSRRIFLPLLFIGIVLTLISFTVTDYFLPLSTIKFSKLYREILYTSPELELESFSVKRYQDSILVTGNVEGKTISDIVIIDKTDEKNKRVITASSARLSQEMDQVGVTSLSLKNIVSLTPVIKENGDYEYFTASGMVYNILLKNISSSVRNLTPREMGSADIYRAIQVKKEKQDNDYTENQRQIESLMHKMRYVYESDNPNPMALAQTYRDIYYKLTKSPDDRNLRIYRIELHKKFSVPIACLIFLYFSFPIALNARKSGRSTGFGIGLFVAIFYWSLLFAGQTMGMRLNFSPVLSMWFPDIIIFLLGTFFMIKRLRR